MRQERYCGLALMHVNYDVEISVHQVLSIFVKKPSALSSLTSVLNKFYQGFRCYQNCLFLYQKQPLRVILEKRCSEICNQNP